MKYGWTSKRNEDAAAIALAERVEKLGKLLSPLGLAHFHIDSVNITDELEDAIATVVTSEQYDHVRFYFHSSFVDDPATDAFKMDQTILHEWLHVAFRDFDFALRQVSKWMPEATYDDWNDLLVHEREGLIDRLATIICLLQHDRTPQFTP